MDDLIPELNFPVFVLLPKDNYDQESGTIKNLSGKIDLAGYQIGNHLHYPIFSSEENANAYSSLEKNKGKDSIVPCCPAVLLKILVEANVFLVVIDPKFGELNITYEGKDIISWLRRRKFIEESGGDGPAGFN